MKAYQAESVSLCTLITIARLNAEVISISLLLKAGAFIRICLEPALLYAGFGVLRASEGPGPLAASAQKDP